MAGRASVAVAADLARGAARFAAWRRHRQLGARIPARLWNVAVALAERHGVSRASGALAIDYYSLQARVEARRGSPAASPAESAAPRPRTFVELPATALGATCECLIEFEKPCGARARIHVRGSQLPDLAALGREFWGAR